jgi:putative MATE family efflux protein
MEKEKKSFLKRGDVDMTRGPITRHLLSFALPLFIGNIFQMLYNTVDTWVVGNFVSSEAFSAVGTVGAALNMMIGLVTGLSNGGTVVISQYYGAGQYDKVKTATHTIMLASVFLGIFLSITGVAIVPLVLRFMKVPDVIKPYSAAYLRIMFGYMIFVVIYNIAAAVLRAVGDSVKPFIFLVISCVTNIILDLVLVIVFDLGVKGVAYATITAQALSTTLVVITMMKSDSCIRLIPKELRIHAQTLKKIISLGIPAALQMTITSFSNMFVQSYINAFGPACMGGWTAYNKIDQFITLPVQSLSLATATFVGQNLGKNQVERTKQGIRKALTMALCFVCVMAAVMYAAAPYVVTFFNSDPEVVSYGTLFLRIISPLFVFFAVYQPMAAAMRGAGNAKAPMYAMLIAGVGFRQLYLFAVSKLFPGNVVLVGFAYPVGWALCSAILVYIYKTRDIASTRIVRD